MLDSRQQVYIYRFLNLFNSILIKDFLSITLQTETGNAQPEDLFKYDSIWITNKQISTYGQHLAKQVSVGFSINPAEKVEPISIRLAQVFLRKIFIEEKNRSINTAKCNRAQRYSLLQ